MTGVTPEGRDAYAVLARVNRREVTAATGLVLLARIGDRAETTRGLHEVADVARVLRRLLPPGE